ncbi:MAG: histidine kinase [Ignavibacteriales bacterium]|nr:histidine kinase [Ignavibacteriales bacterium]
MKLRYPNISRFTFWHYQWIGWSVLLVANIVVGMTASRFPFRAGVEYLGWNVAGFLLTLAMRAYYQRMRRRDLTLPRIIGVSILVSLVMAVVWCSIMWVVALLSRGVPWEKLAYWFKPASFIVLVQLHFPVPFAWSMLYFGIQLWMGWNAEKERTAQASVLTQQAQLQMLRYQINPHFLFNTLNSVRALVDENVELARGMITSLSAYLRYSLVSRNRTLVPAREEVDALKHYVYIEQQRYEEKLQVNFAVDPDLDDFPIPSFLLQPLFENALKYGMLTSPMPLTISITLRRRANGIQIVVANTGTWLEPVEANGNGNTAGLENVRLRLEAACPDHHRLNVETQSEKVTVTIDCEHHEEESKSHNR